MRDLATSDITKALIIVAIALAACGGWELVNDSAQAAGGPTEVCVDGVAYLIWPQGVVAKVGRTGSNYVACF